MKFKTAIKLQLVNKLKNNSYKKTCKRSKKRKKWKNAVLNHK